MPEVSNYRTLAAIASTTVASFVSPPASAAHENPMQTSINSRFDSMREQTQRELSSIQFTPSFKGAEIPSAHRASYRSGKNDTISVEGRIENEGTAIEVATRGDTKRIDNSWNTWSRNEDRKTTEISTYQGDIRAAGQNYYAEVKGHYIDVPEGSQIGDSELRRKIGAGDFRPMVTTQAPAISMRPSQDVSSNTAVSGRGRVSNTSHTELSIAPPPSAMATLSIIDGQLAQIEKNPKTYGSEYTTIQSRLMGSKVAVVGLHYALDELSSTVSELRQLAKGNNWSLEMEQQAKTIATLRAKGDPRPFSEVLDEQRTAMCSYFEKRANELENVRQRAYNAAYGPWSDLGRAISSDRYEMKTHTAGFISDVNDALQIIAEGAADFLPQVNYGMTIDNEAQVNLGPRWSIEAGLSGKFNIGDLKIGGNVKFKVESPEDVVIVDRKIFAEKGTAPAAALALTGEANALFNLLNRENSSQAASFKAAVITTAETEGKLGIVRTEYYRISQGLRAWTPQDLQRAVNKAAARYGVDTEGNVSSSDILKIVDAEIASAADEVKKIDTTLRQISFNVERAMFELNVGSFHYEEPGSSNYRRQEGEQSFLTTSAPKNAIGRLQDALDVVQRAGYGDLIPKAGSFTHTGGPVGHQSSVQVGASRTDNVSERASGVQIQERRRKGY